MIAELDRLYVRTRPAKAVTRLVTYALVEGRAIGVRGRWINPLVFALARVALRLPELREVRRPVFIVGVGRSGTTVLGVVLSMHREVGYLNEPKALWHAIHPREDVLGSYSMGPAAYRLDERDATPAARAAARKLYGAYLALTGSRRVVDKYPELVFRAPFVRALFPDARFLVLVRNGWDTCRSIAEQSQQHDWWGVGDRKWRLFVDQVAARDPIFEGAMAEVPALRSPVDRAAVEWIGTMREARRLAETLPAASRTVRYEDLTARPRDTLDEIIDFCDLPHDEKCLRYGESVLSSSRSKPPVDMHPSVRPLFEETMAALGYS